MKKTLQNNSRLRPITLEKGQLWDLNGSNLQINLVGRTLVHYKHSKGKIPKGTPVSIIGIKALEEYLEKNNAVLLKQQPRLAAVES